MINDKSIKKMLGYPSSREPIPAEMKNKVRERAGNKCEVCHKKFVTLEFHHINMKNSDNHLSNLQLLCPNHHRLKHLKKRRVVTSRDGLGRPVGTRLVSKSKITNRKPKKRPNDLDEYLRKLP